MKTKHILAIFILLLFCTVFLRGVIAQDSTQRYLPEGAKARLSKGVIRGISFSPDGAQIAVGSATGVWLYDAHTGAERALFTDHVSETGLVAFSPDGKILATVWLDRPILLWDVATGNLVKSIRGTRPVDVATGNLVKSIERPVFSIPTVLRILEDNRTLLCEYKNGSFQLWDITTGLRIKHFNPRSPLYTSQFRRVWTSTFGSKIITGSLYLNKIQDDGVYAVLYKNGKIRLKNATTGRHLKTLRGGPKGYYGTQLVFSPDGATLAASGHPGTQVFSPDGATLASRIFLNTMHLWDVSSGKSLIDWDVSSGKSLIDSMQYLRAAGIPIFSEDGKTVAYQQFLDKVMLWDVGTKTFRTMFGKDLDVSIQELAFSPADNDRVASASANGEIRVWDANTGEELAAFSTGHTPRLTALAFSPDGNTLVSGHGRRIKLWDALTFTQLSNGVAPKAPIDALVFSPDGNTVNGIKAFRYEKETRGLIIKKVINEGVKSTLSSWNARTADKLSDLPIESYQGEAPVVEAPMIPNQPRTSFSPVGDVLVFSQNGNRLATAVNSKHAPEAYRFTIHVWDIPDGNLNCTFKGHTDKVTTLAFTRDGKTLASGGADRTVQLWDISTKTRILNLPSGKIRDLAFSTDGKILASIDSTYAIELWDAATGNKLASSEGQSNYRNVVLAFSTDSKILACGGRDGTIWLWDIATGEMFATYKGHVSRVETLAFSSDSKMLVSGSGDGAIFVWNVPH